MFQLPHFAPNGLRILAVCVHVDLVPEFPTVGPDEFLLASMPGDGEAIRVRKILESENGACHFHIEAGYESALPPSGNDAPIEQVLSAPANLIGSRQAASTWGRFRIARDEMSEDCVIRAISGSSIPSPSKAYELTIAGCTLDVTGDGPIRELRWWPVGDAEVGIEVCAYFEVTVGDNMLLDTLAILEDGLNQFVRMRTPARGTT